ncbi:MAG: glycosyltransferase family 4 protein [Chlorobi bacterium]|nr:glycosyltransferase family 4 protein [Chlorobiota bacterium]
MSRIKICFFNTVRSWGGGEKWHFEVSKYLHDRGYDVLLVCQKGGELHKRTKEAGIPHIAKDIGNLSYLNPFKVNYFTELFKTEGISAVVMNLSSDVKLAAHAAKKAGVKRIIYRRGSAIPLKNTFYNRYIFSKWVNEILVNSEETKRTINLKNPNLFPESKITVIYNGIDTKLYSGCEKKDAGGNVVLGNVARLEHEKGHKYLIEVARSLKERGLGFKLKIAGKGSLHDELQQMIKSNNLTGEVELSGFRNDVHNFLKDVDVFLLGSVWEGFGYVTVEAMSCGKPVVAFDISCNPELIVNNETGFTVPPFDVNIFADKVYELATDKSLRKIMGQKARARAVELFDIEVFLARIEQYLTSE